MKLLRFGAAGSESPGAIDEQGNVRDLSSIISDITKDQLSDKLLERLQAVDLESLPLVDGSERIGIPVRGIGKIIAIGLNYSDHAREVGAPIPEEPIVFMKANGSQSGPNDPVVIPRNSVKTDWEVELGVVIGKEGLYIDENDALDYVAGYCIVNDVSEREYQTERNGQWVKGKSFPTFAPIGPWLVTRDEISDPQNLKLWCEVDGKRYQDGTTETMIFGVKKVVSYLSQFMTLMPGDVITTGTPPGVGMGQNPPTYLKPGQVMSLGIEGLGVQRQELIDFDEWKN